MSSSHRFIHRFQLQCLIPIILRLKKLKFLPVILLTLKILAEGPSRLERLDPAKELNRRTLPFQDSILQSRSQLTLSLIRLLGYINIPCTYTNTTYSYNYKSNRIYTGLSSHIFQVICPIYVLGDDRHSIWMIRLMNTTYHISQDLVFDSKVHNLSVIETGIN